MKKKIAALFLIIGAMIGAKAVRYAQRIDRDEYLAYGPEVLYAEYVPFANVVPIDAHTRPF